MSSPEAQRVDQRPGIRTLLDCELCHAKLKRSWRSPGRLGLLVQLYRPVHARVSPLPGVVPDFGMGRMRMRGTHHSTRSPCDRVLSALTRTLWLSRSGAGAPLELAAVRSYTSSRKANESAESQKADKRDVVAG
jgi:hypothetical protein